MPRYSAFGGPTASWAELLGQHNPFTAGARDEPTTLRELEEGRGALGYYAGQPNLTNPFVDWLTSPTTHRQLWDQYLAASSTDPGLWFQDWLAANDPRLRWMNLTPQERGE